MATATDTTIEATEAELEAAASDEADEELLVEEISIDGMCGVY